MAVTLRPAGWIERLARLYTPVVADVLDKLGYRQQVMRADVRPLFPTAKSAGFALTVQTVPAREITPAAPYAGELAAVDALQKNDVMVVLRSDWSFWASVVDGRPLPWVHGRRHRRLYATRSRSSRWASRFFAEASIPPTAWAG